MTTDLSVPAVARLAGSINVQTLPHASEFCFGGYSSNYFSSSAIIEILNVAASQADQVYVGFHVGIKPGLAFGEIQFLNKSVFCQNPERFVDRCKTDR
jgi:hypothetical protein